MKYAAGTEHTTRERYEGQLKQIGGLSAGDSFSKTEVEGNYSR